eukprot:127211_1
MSLLDMFNIIAISINTLLTIVMIFWFYTFYKIRHVPEISARKPNASLLAGFLCIIGTLLSHNLQIIFLNTSTIEYIPYTNLLMYLFVMMSSQGTYHVLTFRAFMVYYDIKWNKAMEDKKWRLYIDPEETNWFLKHRNSWGSPKRAIMIACIHWIFWMTIGVSSFFYISPNTPNSTIARGTIVFSAIPILIVDIILYFKFPKFNDIYRIHDEILMIIKYKVIAVTTFFVIAMAMNAPAYSLSYLLAACLGVSVAFGFVLIIYFWVFKTFNLPITPCTINRFMIGSNLNEPSYLSTELHMDKTNELNHINLRRVLSDSDGFNCFARHLTKEFCLENLLFIVETQQWLTSLLMKEEYQKFIDTDILNKMNINKTHISQHMHQITASISKLVTVLPDLNKLHNSELLVPE